MGEFIKGEIVVLPFPFSNLSASKRRPALVIADWQGEDIILLQITSKNVKDEFSVSISPKNIENGSLQLESNIRCNKIFTADKSIIEKRIGNISGEKLEQVINKLIKIINK